MRYIGFFSVFIASSVLANGGVMLDHDACKVKIGFYEAHITAYQPETSGNTQFCEELPDAGKTIFVIDYLHDSMKEVPVGFRIIRDATGLGRFVRREDIEALNNLDEHTIYYQAPTVEADASLTAEPLLPEAGSYVGIVSVGHPTNDTIYTAVFPFEVGRMDARFIFMTVAVLVAALLICLIVRMRIRRPQEA